MPSGEFSVYQWFIDGSYEPVCRFVSAKDAFGIADGLTQSVGGKLGTTVRVIITDGGDDINWEWKYNEGVVFPKKDAVV